MRSSSKGSNLLQDKYLATPADWANEAWAYSSVNLSSNPRDSPSPVRRNSKSPHNAEHWLATASWLTLCPLFCQSEWILESRTFEKLALLSTRDLLHDESVLKAFDLIIGKSYLVALTVTKCSPVNPGEVATLISGANGCSIVWCETSWPSC